ncbi:MAG: hypothetical protein FWF56_00855 [Firmicutes bacterium]|nr:hypothetical protein [Bacillota bacterium]MCL1953447.1 hypothetical protein [Bacillota bacterium]
MDINSILPLLLKNKQNSDNPKTDEQSSTDQMQLINNILSGNADQSTIVSALASKSGNPQLAQTLSMAQNLKSNSKKANAQGLKAIKPFVNNDIMGKLTKYFS